MNISGNLFFMLDYLFYLTGLFSKMVHKSGGLEVPYRSL